MKFNTVIFDFDGTMGDSMSAWETVPYDYLRNKGIETDEDILSMMRSMNLKNSLEYVKNKYKLVESVDEITNGILSMVEDFYRIKMKEKPYLAEFVKFLKGKGIKIAVATSNSRRLVDLGLQNFGLTEYVDVIFGAEDVKTDKTQPDIYLSAAKAIGGSVESTAIFEDAIYAIKTAKNAGFFVFGIEDEVETEDISLIADVKIRSYEEAVKYFVD